jgi:uncharacterized phage protein (TIGR01671 family)
MNNLKLKAWWNNKMYYVAGIFFATQQEGEPEWENWGTPKHIALMDDPENSKLSWDYAEECILLQFTGFQDKNGFEIYEGDLIDFYGQTCQVIYQDGAFWVEDVRESSLSDYGDSLLRDIHTKVEVIGNINENPPMILRILKH